MIITPAPKQQIGILAILFPLFYWGTNLFNVSWGLIRKKAQRGVIFTAQLWKKSTLPEINIAPRNGWLEYYLPIGEAYFQGLCSFQGGQLPLLPTLSQQCFPPKKRTASCFGSGSSPASSGSDAIWRSLWKPMAFSIAGRSKKHHSWEWSRLVLSWVELSWWVTSPPKLAQLQFLGPGHFIDYSCWVSFDINFFKANY